ncbi:aminoglycoside phosphotransferase family protein [Streptomyces sp. MMBL 11-3]|uniref:aminoglycoside phosphotransferase family protein n=1 Tax=Streptomyces sp. MMBL 11-3 TaxID=3382639 RepID=UPI0039B65D2B
MWRGPSKELFVVSGESAGMRPAIDTELVRRLVDAQFPQWAGLPLTPVDPAGSDHVIHRLGERRSVRLPRHAGAAGQAGKESWWLPRLAPHLPLAVPVPVAVGAPGFGYPWPWAVSRWLEGEVASVEALTDPCATAVELARFLTALQRLAPGGVPAQHVGDVSLVQGVGPVQDVGGDLAGGSLAERDRATRSAIARTGGVFDTAAMTGLWDAALDAPGWGRPAVWFHGDFHTGNLLTVDGRLSAVIDFGGLGVGDPACDLIIAFTLLSAGSRAAFRAALAVDDATWTRGRGWALATALNAYTHYAAVDPRVAAQTTRQIHEALIG